MRLPSYTERLVWRLGMTAAKELGVTSSRFCKSTVMTPSLVSCTWV